MSTRQPIGGAPSWRGAEVQASTEWMYRLSPDERAEIEAARQHFIAVGVAELDASQADFPLPSLGAKFRRLMRQAEYGGGFLLIRNLPIENLTEAEVRTVYWGISLHIGVVVPQSAEFEMMGDVRNRNDDMQVTRRGYRSNADLHFHTDSADVVMLLCRRKAKAGGFSLVASAAAIHDHLLETRPDLLEALYLPAPIKAIDPNSPHVYYMCPIFDVHDGYFYSRFQAISYPIKFKFENGPELTPLQIEGIEAVRTLAREPRFHFHMQFESGDLQVLFNHLVYHGRGEFEDHEEHDLKRHVLRMWASIPTDRELPKSWEEAYVSRAPYTLRGGEREWRFPDRFGDYYRRTAANLGMKV
ncbi:hypothetical protein BH09PSE5_BH09PSE5_28720 [soil metagenome]